VANSHYVFKLNPVPYDVQVQHLVQQAHYDLAMQICVSDFVMCCGLQFIVSAVPLCGKVVDCLSYFAKLQNDFVNFCYIFCMLSSSAVTQKLVDSNVKNGLLVITTCVDSISCLPNCF